MIYHDISFRTASLPCSLFGSLEHPQRHCMGHAIYDFPFFRKPTRSLLISMVSTALSLSLSIYWYSRVHRSKSSCGHGCCSRHAEFIRSCCGWDFSRLWVARREVGPSLGMLLTSCYVSGCHAFWAGTFGWQRRANMG